MDDVALGSFQIPLLLPHIIGDVIPAHPQVEVILRNPKEGQYHILVAFVFRGKTRTKAVISVVEDRSRPP